MSRNRFIELQTVCRDGNRVTYPYRVSDDLQQYFSDKPFWIEYPESVENVPDAVLAIPFVCSVLPIVWLTDAALMIPELDEAFFECIPKVKQGYETMYPETEWKGEIVVDNVVSNTLAENEQGCAMFFSGGVDSVQTLISHLEEKPVLLSVWGSDVSVDNEQGWRVLEKALGQAANELQLTGVTIRSSFRQFDKEGELDRAFSEQLKDGWWHGVKHGIGLIGHAAPYAYLHGLKQLYIASTFSDQEPIPHCASYPLIDNQVRFVNCQVIHDGFQFSRQDKVHNIVAYCRDKKSIPLHVCWKTQTGKNCCQCEKCFRTIAGILAENGDPAALGFSGYEAFLPQMRETSIEGLTRYICIDWKGVKKQFCRNQTALKHTPYWKYLKWIASTDFEHPAKIQLPLFIRLKKAKGIRGKLGQFRFYQALHRLKEKLR